MSQTTIFPVAEDPKVLRARTATEVLDAIEEVLLRRINGLISTLHALDIQGENLERNQFATNAEKDVVKRQRQMARERAIELLNVGADLAAIARDKFSQDWRFRALLDKKGQVGR